MIKSKTFLSKLYVLISVIILLFITSLSFFVDDINAQNVNWIENEPVIINKQYASNESGTSNSCLVKFRGERSSILLATSQYSQSAATDCKVAEY